MRRIVHVELLHANCLALAHELFCIFANSAVLTRIETNRWHRWMARTRQNGISVQNDFALTCPAGMTYCF